MLDARKRRKDVEPIRHSFVFAHVVAEAEAEQNVSPEFVIDTE
jgi:hypothetical protein